MALSRTSSIALRPAPDRKRPAQSLRNVAAASGVAVQDQRRPGNAGPCLRCAANTPRAWVLSGPAGITVPPGKAHLAGASSCRFKRKSPGSIPGSSEGCRLV